MTEKRPEIIRGMPLATRAMAHEDAMQRAFDVGYRRVAIDRWEGQNHTIIFKRGYVINLYGAIFSEITLEETLEGWVWVRESLLEKKMLQVDLYHNICVLDQGRPEERDWEWYTQILAMMADGTLKGIPMRIVVPEGFDIPKLTAQLREWRDAEAL